MRLLYFQAIFIKVICEYWIFSVLAFCTCIFCFGSLARDLTFPQEKQSTKFSCEKLFRNSALFQPNAWAPEKIESHYSVFTKNVEAAVKKNENVTFRLLKLIKEIVVKPVPDVPKAKLHPCSSRVRRQKASCHTMVPSKHITILQKLFYSNLCLPEVILYFKKSIRQNE